ncbi:DNA repair protein rad51d [Dissophora globulifera]|uniref:DNA repair protein rad51d n=1 Tax=Dissophora globulifera TaxID=979702 RepID=A0A9P6RLS7_9FUNG|nr:DNA repair protein rad51d [Dissophora globulifera]
MVHLLVQSKTSRAIWIDTLDGGFSARRTSDVIRAHIARLATERVEMTLTEDRIVDILSRIHVYACRDIYDVIGVVETIRSSCDKTSSEQVQPAQLIVIDSLTTVLTGLLHGTDGAGHATMMHTSRELRGLARDFNIAVLMSYPEEQSPSILMTNNTKPSLGSSWRYATDLQLFLTRLSRVRRHQWQQQPANVLTGEARVVARSNLFGDEVDESAIRVPEDSEGFASMRVAEIMKSKRLRIGEWSLFNLAPGHGNGM